MGLTVDLDLGDEPTVRWPATADALPAGWSWGRHVSMVGSEGYFALRDSDGASVVCILRPDLDEDDVPDLDAAVAAVAQAEAD